MGKLALKEQAMQEDLGFCKVIEESEKVKISDLQDVNEKLAAEIKDIEQEYRLIQQDKVKHMKESDQLKRKIGLQAEKKHEIDVQREELKDEFKGLYPQVEILRKQAQKDADQVKELFYERDTLNMNLVDIDDHTKKEVEKAKVHRLIENGGANRAG